MTPKQLQKLDAKSRAMYWLMECDTGQSSINLCRAWYFGRYNGYYPRDKADADRCVAFLRIVPEAAYVVDAMVAHNPNWSIWAEYIKQEASQ